MSNDVEDIGPKKETSWVRIIILCAVVAILLALVAVPNFVRSPHTAPRNWCINNLRQLDGAKEQYTLEHNCRPGAVVSMDQLVGTNKYMRHPLSCPQGGTYTLGRIGEPPRCSIKGHELSQ